MRVGAALPGSPDFAAGYMYDPKNFLFTVLFGRLNEMLCLKVVLGV